MLNLNLAQVLVAVPENATDAQVAAGARRHRASGAARPLRRGLLQAGARETPIPPDRANGGALGMRRADRYPPLVRRGGPVHSGGRHRAGRCVPAAGFHVLKVDAPRTKVGSADAAITQTHARYILLQNDPKRTTEQAVAQLAEFKRRIEASGGSVDFACSGATTRRTAAPRTAAISAGHAPGMYVPEFEEATNRPRRRARSATPWCRASAST